MAIGLTDMVVVVSGTEGYKKQVKLRGNYDVLLTYENIAELLIELCKKEDERYKISNGLEGRQKLMNFLNECMLNLTISSETKKKYKLN